MNPRNSGAPGKETSIVDDFPLEEQILDSPIDPLEMFAPESRKTRATPRPAVLDLGEFPLRQSRRAVTTVPAARPKARRSLIRFVSKAGVVVALIVVALIAGAAVRNRLDVSAVSDYLRVALSSYLPAAQIAKPAPSDVSRPPAEVAADTATAAPTTGTTESQPVTAAATTSVAATKKPALPSPRPPASSPRSGTAAGRASATPRSLPATQSRPASSSGRAVAQTISPPAVPAVRTSPPVPVVNTLPPVAVVNTSPPAAAVNTASPAVNTSPVATAGSPSPVPAASSASPAAAVSPAPAVSPPTAALPPPAPVSPPSAPAGGLTAETRAVAAALNRYQDAFSSLDANAAHAVWPSVDVRALAKAFGQLEEQTFDLEGCNITVAGAQAEADCAGNARYIPKVGNRTLRVEPRRWHFKLRQTNDQWFIDAVDAR